MSHLIPFFRVLALKDLGWENKLKKKNRKRLSVCAPTFSDVLRRNQSYAVTWMSPQFLSVEYIGGFPARWKVSFLVSLSSRKWKNSRSYGFSINFPVYCLPVKTKLAFYAELKVICRKPITAMQHACWRPSPCKRSAKTAVYVIANLILPVQRQCFPKTSRLWFSEVRWNYT